MKHKLNKTIIGKYSPSSAERSENLMPPLKHKK